MDGMLSQEEINALLGGADAGSGSEDTASANSDVMLSPEESDALGESPTSVWEPQPRLFLF